MFKYRKDIDGLRAIAVLSIVIYHCNKAWIPGGFVGVDIFFVISGFLISSIIYRQMEDATFTIKDFYLRRIKRIIPAAMLYTLLILAVTWLVYLPKDLLFVSKSAIASSVFLSNVYFMRNVDYFSPQAEENPFLHMWSLAVEEQFYVVWPILLLFSFRFLKSKNAFFTLYLLIGILSFGAATYLASSPATAKMAFYLMPTRFGELLLGSLLGIYMLHQPKTAQSGYAGGIMWFGLLLILATFFLVDDSTVFPGVAALIPCLGTGCLLWAGHLAKTRHPVMKLLTHPVANYFGKISFSLYLAHWPVLAISRYITQSYELPLAILLCSVIVMWVLSDTTYRLVETPFRSKQYSFTGAFSKLYALPALIAVGFSGVMLHSSGQPERFELTANHFNVAQSESCNNKILKDCTLGDASHAPSALLFGDSHAAFYSSLLSKLGELNGFSIEAMSVSGCAGVFSRENFSPELSSINQCLKLKDVVSEKWQQHRTLIIAERWEARLFKDDGLQEALKTFVNSAGVAEIEVLLLEQIPKYQCNINRSRILEKHLGTPSFCEAEIDNTVAKANRWLKELASEFDHVSTLSLEPVLCPNGQCAPDIDSQLVYGDDDHLSVFGAHLVAERLTNTTELDWVNLLKQ